MREAAYGEDRLRTGFPGCSRNGLLSQQGLNKVHTKSTAPRTYRRPPAGVDCNLELIPAVIRRATYVNRKPELELERLGIVEAPGGVGDVHASSTTRVVHCVYCDFELVKTYLELIDAGHA